MGKVGRVVVSAAFGGDDVVGVDVIAEVEGVRHRYEVAGLGVVVILRRRWVLSTAVML